MRSSGRLVIWDSNIPLPEKFEVLPYRLIQPPIIPIIAVKSEARKLLSFVFLPNIIMTPAKMNMKPTSISIGPGALFSLVPILDISNPSKHKSIPNKKAVVVNIIFVLVSFFILA